MALICDYQSEQFGLIENAYHRIYSCYIKNGGRYEATVRIYIDKTYRDQSVNNFVAEIIYGVIPVFPVTDIIESLYGGLKKLDNYRDALSN